MQGIQRITEAEEVLIRGKCFLYRQKAPFVKSGKSVGGALEYDRETDQVRCHECGKWFVHLGLHINKAHSINGREYKARHGLNLGASLVGIRYAANRSKVAAECLVPLKNSSKYIAKARSASFAARDLRSPSIQLELRNERASCPAQLLERVRQLGIRLGKCPSTIDLRRVGIHEKSALLALNLNSIAELQALAGFKPCGHSGPVKYTKPLLIEMLRDFYARYSRVPRRSDFNAKILPPRASFQNHFGSLAAAYDAAGFGLVSQQKVANSDCGELSVDTEIRTEPICVAEFQRVQSQIVGHLGPTTQSRQAI